MSTDQNVQTFLSPHTIPMLSVTSDGMISNNLPTPAPPSSSTYSPVPSPAVGADGRSDLLLRRGDQAANSALRRRNGRATVRRLGRG